MTADELLRANVHGHSDQEVDVYAASVGGYEALLGTVFEGLRERIVPEKDVAVGFSLADGEWSLGVVNGVAFCDRAIASVQATVRMSPRDFLRMIVRESTGPELMAQRRMTIEGQPYFVSRLFSMIPGGVVTGATEVETTIAAEPGRVWTALTGELAGWFCEHADVDLDAGRYDFWGRYTLGAPSRADGRHKLLDVEIGRRIRFAWPLFGAETTAEFTLTPSSTAGTTVRVVHDGVPMRNDGPGTRNFWELALLNLRCWVELGRTPPLLDLSTDTHGGFAFSIDVDAPPDVVFDDLYNDQAGGRAVGETWQVDVGVPVAVELLRADAPSRLDHSWTPAGSTTSVVSWTLEDSGGRTRLTIVHSGMDADYDAAGEMQGWFAAAGLQIKFRCEHGRWDFTPHHVRVLQATTR